MHCTRANWQSTDLRERAGERGLTDAGVILDQYMTLGQQGDDHVVEHLIADLDGALDVRRDAASPPLLRRQARTLPTCLGILDRFHVLSPPS